MHRDYQGWYSHRLNRDMGVAVYGHYGMRDSMDGMYDDNFYFNNPVDYMANQNDPWFLHQYASCDNPPRDPLWSMGEQRPDLQISAVLASQGIAHYLDDWGPEGRTRMALLASPNVTVLGRAFLEVEKRNLLR